MLTLYDSDSYRVLHLLANAVVSGEEAGEDGQVTLRVPALARHGFEIMDKRTGKEVYLDGGWAELFQRHLQAWQAHAPTAEEIEDTLEGFAELAQNPVVVH